MMSYFGLREWTFYNQNINSLSKCLIQNKQPNLQFDMKTIDWNEYFLYYLPGIKKYFFKENSSNVKENKRHYER